MPTPLSNAPKIGLLTYDPEKISNDLRPTFSELSNGELAFSARGAFRPSLSLTVPARFGFSPNFLIPISSLLVRYQVTLGIQL